MKKYISLIIFISFVVGIIFSLSTNQILKMTGNDKFCALCHLMKPMVDTYKNDIHGGNNALGIKANCVDCHLPHDNLAHYIYKKAINGITEVGIMIFTNTNKIDWYTKREKRNNFIYDNGCLKCHSLLLDKKDLSKTKMANTMHFHYEKHKHKLKCVSCHFDVGHRGLRSELNKYKPQYSIDMNHTK